MGKVIAIGNQKGGVGKTTTAVNCGDYFARAGKRVLVVDLDGQGHVAASLGVKRSDGVYRWLVEERPIWQVVVKARENLDVITNDHTAEEVKAHLLSSDFRAYAIGMALEGAVNYDLVFLDMPPSTDMLHVSALVASDYVIVPSMMDYLALDGIGYIIQAIRKLSKYPNVTPPTVIGILPTMFDRTTNETAENVSRIQKAFGSDLVLPPIPRDTRVREANSFGKTIWEYAPKSVAAVGWPHRGMEITNTLGNVGGYLHLAEIIESWIS